MENANGGQNLSDSEKRQRTATELARKKVLEIYGKTGQVAKDYSTATAESPAPKVKAEDWKKYHSAWQDYYKKYYGEYYGRAARDYVARERMRIERKQLDLAANERAEREEEMERMQEALASAQRESAQARERMERAERETGEARAAADAARAESAEASSAADLAASAEQITPSDDDILARNANAETVQNNFRAKIRKNVEKRARKMRKSRHFVPIAIGVTILLVGLFLQFNQVIVGNVMAYMSPGNSEVNEIAALDPTIAQAVHDEPTLIIPKINVEVPVRFGAGNSVEEMNAAMDNGVAHYSIPGASALPGQIGNFVISGHSAGDIFQTSNYKFIFSGLTRLEEGDLMYMDYEGVRYTYKMTGSVTVEPTNVGSLREITENNAGKPVITLITCTPLGTSRYRLLVYGEQIYPSYDGASSAASASEEELEEETSMPANAPTVFEALWRWLTGA